MRGVRKWVSGASHTTIPYFRMILEASSDYGVRRYEKKPREEALYEGLEDPVETLPGCAFSMSWSLLHSGLSLWDWSCIALPSTSLDWATYFTSKHFLGIDSATSAGARNNGNGSSDFRKLPFEIWSQWFLVTGTTSWFFSCLRHWDGFHWKIKM